MAQAGASFSDSGPHFNHGLPQICNAKSGRHDLEFRTTKKTLVVQGRSRVPRHSSGSARSNPNGRGRTGCGPRNQLAVVQIVSHRARSRHSKCGRRSCIMSSYNVHYCRQITGACLSSKLFRLRLGLLGIKDRGEAATTRLEKEIKYRMVCQCLCSEGSRIQACTEAAGL